MCIRDRYKTVQTRLDRVLGLTRENLTGVRVVRAFDKEQSEIDRFEDASALLTGMQLHVGHLSALMNQMCIRDSRTLLQRHCGQQRRCDRG